MTSAFATAPYSISYATRTPYLSVAEYANAPTSMDLANLVPGGSAAAQLTALQETINRASSWIDQVTCGAWGSLCATNEVENARSWGTYRNTIAIHTKYWPILQVTSFQYSAHPSGLAGSNGASVTPSTSITVYPQEFEVSVTSNVSFSGPGTAGFGGWGVANGIARRVEYDCLYAYTAGWPNTSLAASVAAGAASVQPSSVTGVLPNSPMTIYDLPNDEQCVVASTYVPGAAIVPLTAPLQFAHPATATITNMPPAIKQAAILATTAFIKQRGSGALIAADIGEVTRTQSGFSQNSGSDWDQARSLLNPFRQAFVGN